MKYALPTLVSCGLAFAIGCGEKDGGQTPVAAPPALPQAAPPPIAPQPPEELAKPKTATLMEAAGAGNVNDVKFYLRQNPAALKVPNENGMYALHLAADHGHGQVIRILLQAGADVNAQNTNDQATPLQYAATGGHLEAVQILLDAKANINATDRIGRTPLMWAASSGQASMAQLLLDRGADANQKTSAGWTALKYAEQGKHEDIAQVLRSRTQS